MGGEEKEIWTVGHSTRSAEGFVALLQAFRIQRLVDIRTFPGSRRYPHFNKEALSVLLDQYGIAYFHMAELGGRRKPRPDSSNIAWRNTSFRGYADYMETRSFTEAAGLLEQLARDHRLAYMCSEAVWWRCHRALVSDYLKARSWKVIHIMDEHTGTEHPFTSPAKTVQGKLFY